MGRPSNRGLILEAAERVALEAGAAQLTLDAVAEEAGVSKGGLLYHFPSKSVLLEAMLENLLGGYEQRRDEKRASLPENEHRDFLAEMAAGLDVPPEPRKQQLGTSLLAVVVHEPGLLERCRSFHARRYACGLAEDGDLPKAMLLLALDGFKLLDLLQVSPFSETDRQRIRDHLHLECQRVTSLN